MQKISYTKLVTLITLCLLITQPHGCMGMNHRGQHKKAGGRKKENSCHMRRAKQKRKRNNSNQKVRYQQVLNSYIKINGAIFPLLILNLVEKVGASFGETCECTEHQSSGLVQVFEDCRYECVDKDGKVTRKGMKSGPCTGGGADPKVAQICEQTSSFLTSCKTQEQLLDDGTLETPLTCKQIKSPCCNQALLNKTRNLEKAAVIIGTLGAFGCVVLVGLVIGGVIYYYKKRGGNKKRKKRNKRNQLPKWALKKIKHLQKKHATKKKNESSDDFAPQSSTTYSSGSEDSSDLKDLLKSNQIKSDYYSSSSDDPSEKEGASEYETV